MLLDCEDISITERWWREQRDLIDIFDPVTCTEIPESASHSDRYEIDTDHLSPGDTLRLLVCKTDPEDDFVMEFSATPGSTCSTFRCAPQMSCPVETSLHPDGQCRYIIPDFVPSVVLRDTCMTPPTIVTSEFTIMQNPPPGAQVEETLFVEIQVATDQGEIIAACDISILLAPNTPPQIDEPDDIEDILVSQPFPPIQDIFATDTVGLGIIQQIPAFGIIDPFVRNDCEGFLVTYRWSASDGCGVSSEITTSFNVLPDDSGPIFVSDPVLLDTVQAGEDFPPIEDLQAQNPDGSVIGVEVTSSIDSFVIDNCLGYQVTYRWIARDSCEDQSTITTSFFVEPDRAPPTFVSEPVEIPNIYASDSLPVPEVLIAISTEGTTEGVLVEHSFEVLDGDPCDSLEVICSWVATDTCGLTTEVTTEFFILPDTLTGFANQGLEDLMLESNIECSEVAQIVVPLSLDQIENHVVTVIILDENGELIDEFIYTGPEDYQFGTGAFQVIYVIEDQCGNSLQDTINLQVADVSAPLFVCNNDQFIILTDFNSCTAIADWPVPVVQDNCDDVILSQISGPELGQDLPIGTYEIVYEASDLSGNTSTCSFVLIVSSSDLMMLDCSEVELYIDATCEASLTIETILNIESIECLPDFELSIFTETDTLTGDTIDIMGHLNQGLIYEYCNVESGICCSNNIIVLDTIAPVISCTDTVRISCLEDPLAYRPAISQECTNIIWQVREFATEEVCDLTEVSTHITREFIAIDQAGNASEACVVVLQVLRANLIDLSEGGDIVWPSDTIVSCDVFDITQLSLRTLGSPLLSSDQTLIRIEDACNLISFPTDRVVSEMSCTTVIERIWTLSDGSCDQNQQEITNVQKITIIDDNPPTANILADTFRVLVNRDDCYGYFNASNIPIQLNDGCQSSSNLSWNLILNGDFILPLDSILLPYGLNQIPIAILDGCGNIGYDTLHVRVRDHIIPVAACIEHTVISVTDDEVFYPVEALDIGSSDNCEIAEILVRKMDRTCPSEDSRFREYVRICCADVGETITLMLKVIDQAGNENYCTGTVQVQDELAPTISCPPDLVVSCTIELSKENETDQYGHLFGRVGGILERGNISIHPRDFISSSSAMLDGYAEDNCGTPDTILVTTREEMNDCGTGFIYRSFTAVDRYGNQSETCIQTIEIRGSGDRLDNQSIRFPREEITLTSCGDRSNISPDFLGRPEIIGGSCLFFGTSYEDAFLNSSEDTSGTCTKIIRTWTIVDWCDRDPLDNAITYQQVIKLTDQKAPIFPTCVEVIQYSEPSDDCDDILVNLSSYALDDCVASSSLRWTLEIDFHTTGQVDEKINITPDSSGHVEANVYLPVGGHNITWTVTDPCDNSSKCLEHILVENSKPPTPIAIGIATTLGDDGTVDVWAEDIIIRTEHPCRADIQQLVSRLDEGIDDAQTSIRFDCTDIGVKEVKAYAAVELTDGSLAYSSTIVSIAIRDAQEVCDPSINNSAGHISGIVYLEDGRLVPDVELSLHQSFTNQRISGDTTGVAGLYDLGDISDDAPYLIAPSLETQVTDGLSTLDMILVQRHLLGLEVLESPYKIIASDVNQDRRVSSSDLLHMRRALLRLPSDLDNYPSWRFVDDQQYFRDLRFPMEEELPTEFFVTYENPILDLIAVKVGDVNGSIELPNDHLSASRSTTSLLAEDLQVHKNEEIIALLQTPVKTTLSGYQMTMSFDYEALSLIDVTAHNHSDIVFNEIQPGLILVTSIGFNELEKGDPLIQIKFIGKKEGRLSEFLSLEDGPLDAELYTGLLAPHKLSLHYINQEESKTSWSLESIVPNPFIKRTAFTIDLSKRTDMKLEVFDIAGRLVVDTELTLDKGFQSIELSSRLLPIRGIYGYRLSSSSNTITGKLIYN